MPVTMNPALESIQDALMKQHRKLRDMIPTAPDAAARQALLTEMAEITHRIQITGSLLFSKQTKELDDKVGALKTATKDVNKAIADLKALKGFLDAMSKFLSVVDEAIDLAKKLL
jgi:hypothetical protein